MCVEYLVSSRWLYRGRWWKLQEVEPIGGSSRLYLVPVLFLSLLPVHHEGKNILHHAPAALMFCFPVCIKSMDPSTTNGNLSNLGLK
jgi:hypothetical protein